MHLTAQKIKLACSSKQARARVDTFYPYLVKYLPAYSIDTLEGENMFLSQILHESGEFLYTRELGSSTYLSKYDTGSLATRLGNTAQADGDGQRYCGRGLIQLTGLDNYKKFSKETGIDVVKQPEYLETPEGAVHSACWFWFRRNLNDICTDMLAVTRRINGGLNGLEDRQKYFNKLTG